MAAIVTTESAEPRDRTVPLVAASIGAFTALFAVVFVFIATPRFSLGVAIGGVLGLLNFLTLARVGKAFLGSRRGAVLWAIIYLVKVIVLFGGVYLLFRSGWVPALSIVVGLSTLVPGIVVGGLLAAPRDPTSEAS